MTLTNTVVTITVTIPKLELENGGLSLSSARTILHESAVETLDTDAPVTFRILDCPSYPALNE